MLKSRSLWSFSIVILQLIVMCDVISGCACFCVRYYWDSINQTVHDLLLSPGLLHYMYILGALAP